MPRHNRRPKRPTQSRGRQTADAPVTGRTHPETLARRLVESGRATTAILDASAKAIGHGMRE
jgi:hypothetical protein